MAVIKYGYRWLHLLLTITFILKHQSHNSNFNETRTNIGIATKRRKEGEAQPPGERYD